MKAAGIASALLSLLACGVAHAQAGAGAWAVEIATGDDADAGIEAAETASAPPVTAPTAAPAAPRAYVSPVIPAQTKARQLHADSAAYSPVEDARYKGAIAGGIILEVGGAGAIISSGVYFILSAWPNMGCGHETDECREESEKDEERFRTTGIVLASIGLAAVAVGIPLIVYGHRGHRRQKALRLSGREPTGSLRPPPLVLAFSSAEDGRGGGLVLSGTF
jgi:hypothetical protein